MQLIPVLKTLADRNKTSNFFPNSGILFVHIPKTGGSSVREYLRRVDRPELRFSSRLKYYELEQYRKEQLATIHGKARHYRTFVPDSVWKESFKFACIRNPWDMMVSCYFWWKQYSSSFQRLRHMYWDICEMSFQEFIRSGYGTTMINECVGDIEDWVQDKDGNLLLDALIKLESFEEDFRKVVSNLPYNLVISAELGRVNTTRRGHYSEFYDDETREIVERRFEYMINVGDYRYGQ